MSSLTPLHSFFALVTTRPISFLIWWYIWWCNCFKRVRIDVL